VSSVTLMRRLSSNSRKNQIYKAFREVGRVMRTVALLRFLADSGLRARVTAVTNKAEADNGFSAWTPVRQPGRDRRGSMLAAARLDHPGGRCRRG
jgi:TnpA family transposase